MLHTYPVVNSYVPVLKMGRAAKLHGELAKLSRVSWREAHLIKVQYTVVC